MPKYHEKTDHTRPKKRESFREILAAILIIVAAVSICFNIYQYQFPRVWHGPMIKLDTDSTITQIETYLNQISPDYIAAVQTLAKEYNLPSWGCGPSSYAMAVILNKRFFQNKFPINASYDPNETYQIVERFSFEKTDTSDTDYVVTDHAWIEVYLGTKFLYIDPTIGQFGKYTTIVYEQFTVGDPNLSEELAAKYGIEDVRFARLMQKMIDRVPTDQEPYPGASINEASMGYYDQVLADRNDVQAGKEPADWMQWVSTLTNEFH